MLREGNRAGARAPPSPPPALAPRPRRPPPSPTPTRARQAGQPVGQVDPVGHRVHPHHLLALDRGDEGHVELAGGALLGRADQADVGRGPRTGGEEVVDLHVLDRQRAAPRAAEPRVVDDRGVVSGHGREVALVEPGPRHGFGRGRGRLGPCRPGIGVDVLYGIGTVATELALPREVVLLDEVLHQARAVPPVHADAGPSAGRPVEVGPDLGEAEGEPIAVRDHLVHDEVEVGEVHEVGRRGGDVEVVPSRQVPAADVHDVVGRHDLLAHAHVVGVDVVLDVAAHDGNERFHVCTVTISPLPHEPGHRGGLPVPFPQ